MHVIEDNYELDASAQVKTEEGEFDLEIPESIKNYNMKLHVFEKTKEQPNNGKYISKTWETKKRGSK